MKITDKRIQELIKADEEGRILILPCKPGDTVWIIDYLPGTNVLGPCQIQVFSIETAVSILQSEKNVYLTWKDAYEAVKTFSETTETEGTYTLKELEDLYRNSNKFIETY